MEIINVLRLYEGNTMFELSKLGMEVYDGYKNNDEHTTLFATSCRLCPLLEINLPNSSA
jgi:hypothetical protein